MIGKARVVYTFYPKGTVNVGKKCTDIRSYDGFRNYRRSQQLNSKEEDS